VHFDPIRERRATAHHRTNGVRASSRPSLFLAIILLAIYSAVKIVPIYISNISFPTKCRSRARFSVVNHYTEDQIRNNIFKVVEELESCEARGHQGGVNQRIVKISMDTRFP